MVLLAKMTTTNDNLKILQFHSVQKEKLQLEQRVRLKASEEICGTVKWISPSGIMAGVEFDEETLELLACVPQYSLEYFNCNSRLILAEDLTLTAPTKNTPTSEEQSGILTNIVESLKTFGFVEAKGKGRNKKSRKKANQKRNNLDKNDNQIIPVVVNKALPNCVPNVIPPPNFTRILTGETNRGIQWQANSCYLDSTLFSMFFTTKIFDEALLTDKTEKEGTNELGINVRAILRNEIVYPLRSNLFCPGTNTAKLRDAMKHLNQKLKCSFMDAEEFIFLLLEDSLNVEEFLKYDSGVADFIHQILIDNSDQRKFGFVQDLLETSLNINELKLDGFPNPALLVQMPRSNGSLVHFRAVIPNLSLNLSKIWSEGSCICGGDAVWFCQDCYEEFQILGQKRCRWSCFCPNAKNDHLLSHSEHRTVLLDNCNTEIFAQLDLLAVICIRSAHYTAFVKCGHDRFAPWLYFNSSDKFILVERMGEWLQKLEDNPKDVPTILEDGPEFLRRLAYDCHICIYSSPDQSF